MKEQIKEALKEMLQSGEMQIRVDIDPNYRADSNETQVMVRFDEDDNWIYVKAKGDVTICDFYRRGH